MFQCLFWSSSEHCEWKWYVPSFDMRRYLNKTRKITKQNQMKTIETDEIKRIWNKVSMNGCNFKIWVKSGKRHGCFIIIDKDLKKI